eukprot:TRINITY_DN4517_c0_g1_i1.p1 TRINITY_DN4517_c0_g1~~TRINITY_DN4517_c0_g1_i1.p1  ORF type:complete len:211 (+),score=21.08 TRINITY_DN4517_c0_g1_i1:71-703(+)
MPRFNSHVNVHCHLCHLNVKSRFDSIKLCSVHEGLLRDCMDDILEMCTGNFSMMVDSILTMGYTENQCSKTDLCVLIHKINNRWNVGAKAQKVYNATQSLKQYCRLKYAESDCRLPPPPKNSKTKAEFVQWANDNGISLADFEAVYPDCEKVDKKRKKDKSMGRQGHEDRVTEIPFPTHIPLILPHSQDKDVVDTQKTNRDRCSIENLIN